MKSTTAKPKKKEARKETVSPYMIRLYPKHKVMLRSLKKKLGISEAEIVREAIQEKHAFHLNA